MNLLVTLFTVVLTLVGCSKQTAAEPEPVPVAVTASLVACLTTNNCLQPTTSQLVNGVKQYQITLRSDGKSLQFFYSDNEQFGVTFKISETDQLRMEDRDLDGKLDKVSQTINGKPGTTSYGPGSPLYRDAEWTYSYAMKIAERSIIPPDLLEFMREEEELLREEEEDRRRRYST